MAEQKFTIDTRDLDRVKHTAWGMRIQTMLVLGIPFEPERNTTLNEKFGINTLATVTTNDKIATEFYVIGNQGHRIVVGNDEIAVTEPIDHDPLDAALYNHVPFVLRRVGNDLTDEERINYRLRRKEVYNGVEYIAYYAKRFTKENDVKVLLSTTQHGNVVVDEYTADETNLSPVKPKLSPREVVQTSNTKVNVSAGAVISFDENDVAEFYDVCRIIYGDVRKSLISEIGLLMAADDDLYTSPIDAVRHNELKAATISAFISTKREFIYSNDGFKERLEIGEKTPLLTNSAAAVTIPADD